MVIGSHAAFGPIARKGITLGLPLMLGLILALSVQPATARHHRASLALTDPAKDAALIMDGETGKILLARNAEALRYPASLTKMMTLYLLFDAVRKGQMTLATPLTVSAHAASQAPVKLYMKPGDTIGVEQAIKAIVVRSANDVAVTIAENLGGTESQFAEMMTAKASALGMNRTHFVNASGLPDRNQVSSASDLALLARHLAYDFPQYFHYFATSSFTFRGRSWNTHDNLIGNYEGADGIKTGYTDMSGFNLVSSVVRDGAHIIGVVMGGRTARKRDAEMIKLLDNTFAQIDDHPTLVARAQVPWQAIAQGTKPNPVIAGFNIGTGLEGQQRARTVIASVAPQLRPAGAVDPNDEDAAETKTDPEDTNLLHDMIAPMPVPRPVQTLASYRPQNSLPQPTPRGTQSTVLASYQPQYALPQPAPRSTPPQSGFAATSGVHDWTIQIGAYADASAARTQLASYAEKSMDILGQAARIVVPFQSVDGHTLYRARFGPFIEREARKVCERLTERGQTCFAAIASR